MNYSEALARIPADPAHWSVQDVPVKDFSWRVFRPMTAALPPQGWKLHVSCSAEEINELVSKVISLLIEKKASFKLPSSQRGLQRLNDGFGGREQRGKIVTIYPENERHASALLRAIDEAWPRSQGPRVSGEARLRRESPVSVRYGAFAAQFSEDEFGRPERRVVDESGRSVVDQRGIVTRDPSRLDSELRVFHEEVEFEKEISAGEPGMGKRYLPLRLLRNGAKKVYCGIEVASLESVIIKTSASGTQGEAQLENEYRFLSEIAKLTPSAPLAPRPHVFLPGVPSVLILEEVGGRTLGSASPETQLRMLPLLADAVNTLHSLGIVHRDLKLENVVINGGRLRLIDFDAAAHVGDPNPTPVGTLNHFGPEGNASMAAAAYDIYSLGVCIAHVLLQWNPGLLPKGRERVLELLRFRRAAEGLIALVRRCTSPDPKDRPNAGEVAAALRKEVAGLKARDLTDFSPLLPTRAEQQDFLTPALEAGRASRKYSHSMENGAHGWRNEHMTPDYLYEGLNLGAAGVVLGLLTLDEAGKGGEFSGDIQAGANWLARRAPQSESHGLFTGNAGVALALSVAGKKLQDPKMIGAARARLTAALEGASEIDLLSGKAGTLYAACAMAKILEEEELIDQSAPLVEGFLASAEVSRGVLGWRSSGRLDDLREIFTGPAHGAAGIAVALGSWAKLAGEKTVEDFSVTVLKSVWAGARTNDRSTLRRFVAPHSPDGFKRAWCHGAAGHLWSILLVYGDDPRFSAEIDEIASLLASPAPLGNPTYCHGLAGELELWRMVGQVARHRELAKRKASEAAELLRILASKRDGKTVWHSEEPVTFTPDLWVGFLGPASALALRHLDRHEALLSIGWLTRLSNVDGNSLQ